MLLDGLDERKRIDRDRTQPNINYESLTHRRADHARAPFPPQMLFTTRSMKKSFFKTCPLHTKG